MEIFKYSFFLAKTYGIKKISVGIGKKIDSINDIK